MRDDVGLGGGPGEHDEDEILMGELRAAARHADPVPEESVVAARAAIAWRTVDAELAELAYDSLLDDRPLAGIRGVATPRLLTFEAAGLTLEVEAVAEGPERRLLGQLVPPQPGRIEVRHRGGSLTVEADGMGRFAAAGLRSGPVSLRCDPGAAGAGAVYTDWFLA